MKQNHDILQKPEKPFSETTQKGLNGIAYKIKNGDLPDDLQTKGEEELQQHGIAPATLLALLQANNKSGEKVDTMVAEIKKYIASQEKNDDNTGTTEPREETSTTGEKQPTSPENESRDLPSVSIEIGKDEYEMQPGNVIAKDDKENKALYDLITNTLTFYGKINKPQSSYNVLNTYEITDKGGATVTMIDVVANDEPRENNKKPISLNNLEQQKTHENDLDNVALSTPDGDIEIAAGTTITPADQAHTMITNKLLERGDILSPKQSYTIKKIRPAVGKKDVILIDIAHPDLPQNEKPITISKKELDGNAEISITLENGKHMNIGDALPNEALHALRRLKGTHISETWALKRAFTKQDGTPMAVFHDPSVKDSKKDAVIGVETLNSVMQQNKQEDEDDKWEKIKQVETLSPDVEKKADELFEELYPGFFEDEEEPAPDETPKQPEEEPKKEPEDNTKKPAAPEQKEEKEEEPAPAEDNVTKPKVESAPQNLEEKLADIERRRAEAINNMMEKENEWVVTIDAPNGWTKQMEIQAQTQPELEQSINNTFDQEAQTVAYQESQNTQTQPSSKEKLDEMKKNIEKRRGEKHTGARKLKFEGDELVYADEEKPSADENVGEVGKKEAQPKNTQEEERDIESINTDQLAKEIKSLLNNISNDPQALSVEDVSVQSTTDGMVATITERLPDSMYATINAPFTITDGKLVLDSDNLTATFKKKRTLRTDKVESAPKQEQQLRQAHRGLLEKLPQYLAQNAGTTGDVAFTKSGNALEMTSSESKSESDNDAIAEIKAVSEKLAESKEALRQAKEEQERRKGNSSDDN